MSICLLWCQSWTSTWPVDRRLQRLGMLQGVPVAVWGLAGGQLGRCWHGSWEGSSCMQCITGFMQAALSLASDNTDRVALALSPECRWALLASALASKVKAGSLSCRVHTKYTPDLCIVLKWSMALSLQQAAAQCLGHVSCLPNSNRIPCTAVAAGKEVNFALAPQHHLWAV